MQRRMASLAVVISLCASGLTGACSDEDDYETRRAKQYAAIRRTLTEDLRRQVDTSSVRADVAESAVLFEVEESGAVPGLTYHWARWSEPGTFDTPAYVAVVAARLREHRVVRRPADWWAAMGVWRPSGETDAAEACLELLHVLHDRHSKGYTTFLAQKWSFRSMTSPLEAQQVWAIADDSIHIAGPTPADPTWRTTAWFVGFPGGLAAAHYRCSIPAGHDGQRGVELVMLDSVPSVWRLPR